MNLRKVLSSLALIAYMASVAGAQGAPAAVTVPTVAWELGTVRGVKLKKGTSVDFALPYTITVPEGTAAFLDVASEHGSVRNGLTPTEGPVQDESTAEIHASTGFGDVVVRRP